MGDGGPLSLSRRSELWHAQAHDGGGVLLAAATAVEMSEMATATAQRRSTSGSRGDARAAATPSPEERSALLHREGGEAWHPLHPHPAAAYASGGEGPPSVAGTAAAAARAAATAAAAGRRGPGHITAVLSGGGGLSGPHAGGAAQGPAGLTASPHARPDTPLLPRTPDGLAL